MLAFEVLLIAGALGPWPAPGAGTAPADEFSWWSFLPLTAPAPPEIENRSWVRDPLDRFVLAARERSDQDAPQEVSAWEWARRLRFDLTGLPPTLEEVRLLENGSEEDRRAWIDTLLDSRAFAERMGRHWLDVARFGEDDTRAMAADGSGRERYASAWTYRDWVIDAFDRDLPWDRFVRAQIAGDRSDDPGDVGGLGFLGCGPWFYDDDEALIGRAEEVAERVDVVSRGFLGLSLACARCHDHRYDPLTREDFAAVAGVFANTEYHEVPLDPEHSRRVAEHQRTLDAAQTTLREFLDAERVQWTRMAAYSIADALCAAWRVCGKPAASPKEAAEEAALDTRLLGRWLQFLRDERKAHRLVVEFRRLVESDVGETEVRTFAEGMEREILALTRRQLEIEAQNEKLLARVVPDDDQRPRRQLPNGFLSTLDEVRYELDSLPPAEWRLWYELHRWDLDDRSDEGLRGVLALTDEELEERFDPERLEHLRTLRARIAALEAADPGEDRVHMGVRTLDLERIEPTHVAIRGDPRRRGPEVARGFPAVLSGGERAVFASADGRAELAESVASHALCDRVAVNRIWSWLFGVGLVRTVDDFGTRGELPSHPGLLEHLAERFVAEGRSVKALVRSIVLSATYRSALDDLRPPRALEAECIRDALLAVSGRLRTEFTQHEATVDGGPSFNLGDPQIARRTVYGTVSRYGLDPFLRTFDFPDPGIPAHGRAQTQVPCQELYFENSEFVGVCANALWQDVANPDVPIERLETSVEQVIERSFARAPLPGEVARCVEFLRRTTPPEESPAAAGPRLVRLLWATTEFRTLH